MGKHFSELSPEAQSCIVDAALDDVDPSKVTESVAAEIREWARATDEDISVVLRESAFDDLNHAARFIGWYEQAEAVSEWDKTRWQQAVELRSMCGMQRWPQVEPYKSRFEFDM